MVGLALANSSLAAADSGVGFVVIIISSLNHIVDSVTWTMSTISELDWEGEERAPGAALRTTYIGTPGQATLALPRQG
jgi:hypothetical protein